VTNHHAQAKGWGPPSPPSAAPAFEFVGRYATGLAGNSAEIATLSGTSMYVTSADAVVVDVVDVSNPAAPTLTKRVDLSPYGASVTSVTASDRYVAASVVADPKTDPGTVVLMDKAGKILASTAVGALPDALTFTPEGMRIVVANEGEPNSYGQSDSVDPEGSVSVITVLPFPRGRVHLLNRRLEFDAFNEGRYRHRHLPDGVRIFGPGATVAQDLEPEYVTISPDGGKAYVTLQENNAIAVIDLFPFAYIERIIALGYKDHGLPGMGLDASDRDSGVGNEGAINIQAWDHVSGMYLPDQIAAFKMHGKTFVLSANEGDARDYDGFAEEERAGDVADTSVIPAADDNAQLGRLTVTTAAPATPTGQAELYAFGSRSFSIWDAAGNQVWDSGDLLEQVTARVYPGDFNSDNAENDSFDSRSDNKGPEPEAATVAKIGNRTLGFVGLERQGGVVITDLTDPASPTFLQYLVTRDFIGDAVGPDSGPESISVLERGPGGTPLLAVSNEVTGTVGLFTTTSSDGATDLTLLHNNDGESSLLPSTFGSGASALVGGGIAPFKAVTDREIRSARDDGRSVVNVYAGDAFLAGAALTCSSPDQPTGPVYDAVAQRRIAYDAHIFGNHEFDFTPTFLERFVREFTDGDGNITQPFLSANLDFSGEPTWADLLDADGLIVGEVTDGRVVARSAVVMDPTTTARIGIVAATTPLLSTISSPRNVVVTTADIPETATLLQGEVDRLTSLGIEKIAVVSHLQDIGNDVQLIGLLRDVDIAVAGGGDELLANAGDLLLPGDGGASNPIVGPYPRVVNDSTGTPIPVVTTNGNYKYLGRLDVAFDADGNATVQGGGPKRVVSSASATPPADAVTPDPALVAEVQTPVQACLAVLAATPVAMTDVAFNRGRPSVRAAQSNAGNLVTDAWLDTYDRYAVNAGLPARTATVLAIQNGGGIRDMGGNFLPSSGVTTDPISRLDVINTLPFDNTMVVVSGVTPSDLEQILERSAASLPGQGGQFLQIAGFDVTYDTTKTAQVITAAGVVTTQGERVISMTLDDGTKIIDAGEPVAGAPNVSLVTNNFTANGGDNYPWLASNPNKTVLRDGSGLAIPYERPLREYLSSFAVPAAETLPRVPASDTRYSPFPSGEIRITIL
jgi:2',3'-cyclic-nucleotide 2'-phosphodiesterase (5'-nucleotidase family)